MKRRPARVPRVAKWWAAWVLPAAEREYFLGDLEEGFETRVARDGLPSARRWYRQQAFGAPRRRPARPTFTPRAGAATSTFADGVARDIRLACRHIRRDPRFAAIAITAMAIGTGTSTALFTFANAALLRPLPYPDAQALFVMREMRVSAPVESGGVSYLNFTDLARDTRTASSMAVVTSATTTLTIAGAPTRARGLVVSGPLLATLGRPPQLGRDFTSDDERDAGPIAIMLTHSGWAGLFGGRSDVIGTALSIDGHDARVIGVTARDLFPLAEEPAAFFAPARLYGRGTDLESQNGSRNFRAYAGAILRLAPGVSRDAAQAELSGLYGGLAARFPSTFRNRRLQLDPLREVLVGDAAPVLRRVAAIVALVLLVTIVSVSTLLTARTAAHSREILVRSALGATRWALLQQLLIESLVLALAGGLVGLLVSSTLVSMTSTLLPPDLPRLAGVGIDWRVLVGAGITVVITGVLAGLPAPLVTLHIRRDDAIQVQERQSSTGLSRTLRRALVTAEVALAVPLVVAAGLLANSLVRLEQVRPGFDTVHTLTVPLSLDERRFDGPSSSLRAINAFLDELRTRVRAVPGVVSVALAQSVPLTGQENSTQFAVVGRQNPTRESPSAQLRFVSDGYFETMGIAVTQGRSFASTDGPTSQPVMIVNDAFVRAYLTEADPLGRQISPGWGGDVAKTIVGIAGDVRHRGLNDAPRPEMYTSPRHSSETDRSCSW